MGSKLAGQLDYEEEIRRLLPQETRNRNVYVSRAQVKIPSKSKQLNKELEKMTLQIVKYVDLIVGIAQ